MPVKIRSFGGPATWVLRKYHSDFTSKVMLSFAARQYSRPINSYIKYFMAQGQAPVFANCMIETLNRCNGTCDFCPANRRDEDRPLKKMPEEMFRGIIRQLRDMHWKGKLYLNINNEPFIDKRILSFARYAKAELPGIQISIISNGTLVTPQKMDEMAGVVDELILNDYSEKYTLSRPHRAVYRHVRQNKARFRHMDITISWRYSREILATRAGNAPNKPSKNNTIDVPCIYPFLDLLIFPDGTVGMCCNDCKEISGFGDITENSLLEIWNNEKFNELRKAMSAGRSAYPFCKECDVVDAGEREEYIKRTLQRKKAWGKRHQDGRKGKSTKTDWTSYYQGRKSFFSSFTQKYTLEKILDYFSRLTGQDPGDGKARRVMELGGGNSCFAGDFCCRERVACYDIVDNNALAVELFSKQDLATDSHTGWKADLTKNIPIEDKYDFVYSIGLIEHFTPTEREKVIDNHFRYCRQGGYVLVSFPTPTRKYRFWRRVMELLHVWRFWDETPLGYEDVEKSFEKHGMIVKKELNNKLFLTQMILLIRKTR